MALSDPPVFAQRHLLGVEHLSREEIVALLDLSDEAVAISRQVEKKRATLRGRTQINLFFEASTRTQSSFELAGKRLGADVMNMAVGVSSVKKGETLIDTAMTLNAMRPDILVVRHHQAGAVSSARPQSRLLGHQRRRRRPRAPDPGAARRADHPAQPRPHRRTDRRDLRRHPAFAGGALEHPAARQARRLCPGRRALDADAGRQSTRWASKSAATCARG